jgi:crossover junction endodeoxyribonuclease RuvC
VRVLGIDPGSRTTGWGVVAREAGRYHLVGGGAIRTKTDGPMPERLHTIHLGLAAAIALWKPDCVAIEAIFAHRSSTSALVLGQARGVALLACAQAGLEVFEYNASTVKMSVAGSGAAKKEQVSRMAAALLGERLTGPHDAADAAAIAITHHAHAGRLAAIALRAPVARPAARARPVVP